MTNKLGDVAAAAGLRRIHILMWRDLDDPEAGGSELHTHEIASRWASAGLDVTMRTSFAADHPSVTRRSGYRVVRRAGRYMVFPRAALAELSGLHGPADGLVEIWNGMPFFSPLWARGPRIVFLHHLHAEMWDMTLSPDLARIGKLVEARIAPPIYRGTSIVTLSESSKHELVHDMHFDADRVQVVHPGVDATFSPGGHKADRPLVLAVGRLVPVKRFHLLVDALAALKPQLPELEAVIVGEGYEREALESLIRERGAEEWISLPGRVADDELIDLYRRAWVVASTSAREGWGMTLTEAAACGTPAVATDIAGHRDAVIDGESGLLVDRIGDFPGALERVLTDAALRDRLGAGAVARAARCTWDATALGTLEALAADARRRRVTQATTGTTPAETSKSDDRTDRRSWLPGTLLLALVAYVPFLLSAPGRVSADTKQYLYLDPGRLLADAPYLWDSGYGAGTLTHQNIGYLFPMGPFFWLFDALGVPDWFAQRLWLGSITFAAGAGVLFLLRTLRWRSRWTALAAAFVYMLTPYQLAYTGRISAILLPWAGLPWMIALTARALRRGGWRAPALFALLTLIVGSTNATSLLLVGIAPVLWLLFAVLNGESDARRAVGVALRIGVLCFFASLWWIAGLVLQGGYGINYLDVSETVRTVAEGSSPTEVLRGLGNWFFYGGDVVGPWIPQAVDFTQKAWLLGVSFALPLLALGAAAVTRWRHRAYFVALLVIGTIASVGAFPYDDPSPIGALFKSWATGSTAGLAMRSTPRAVPLVVLALAVLLAAGLDAWAAKTTRVWRTVAVVGVIGLTLLSFVPIWRDGYIADRNSREDIPAYWEEATAALDREGSDTRVFEIPGTPGGNYRWGSTSDPITPGLMDRPWVARELIPYFGSPAAANLAIALDHRMQEGTFEPDSLAPIARLFSSDTVLLRSDLDWERSDTPRPRMLWGQLTDPLALGLEAPRDYGPGAPNVATHFPVVDELELRTPTNAPDPPEVALFGVPDTPKIVHTATTRQPVLVAGDGEALVDLAAAGLIDGNQLILYSASFVDDRSGFEQVLDDGADLVVSDTNRRRAQSWGSIRDATGRTERAGEERNDDDPNDKRLESFPGSDDSDRTVVEERGGIRATATSYGERAVYAPDQRPSNAVDGDPTTAWRVGGEDDPTGERLVLDLDPVVEADHVTLVQPNGSPDDRSLTQVRLHFGNGETLDVALEPTSLAPEGQRVDFPSRDVGHLEIEVLRTNTGELASYGGVNGVGFSEVEIGDDPPHVTEVIRMPTGLLRAAGADSIDHKLVLLMSRLGYDPASTRRAAEEPFMARTFRLPTERTFSLDGQARIDPNAPDATLDEVLGTTGPGAVFAASGHLRGDADARASRAFDADADTAWIAPIGEQSGEWIEARLGAPVTVSSMDLQVVADGRHSVPTRLRLEVDGQPTRTIDVPAIPNPRPESPVATAPLTFEPVTGSSFRVFVDAVAPVTTHDARTNRDRVLPVAIASVGMAEVPAPAAQTLLPDQCTDALVAIDDQPVGVRVTGDVAEAAAGRTVAVAACGGPVELAAGRHDLRTQPGSANGFDVDRLVLGSDRGGEPLGPGMLGAKVQASGAHARVTDEGLTRVDGKVKTDGDPFWLVLGQSENKGWELEVDGGADVGDRTLVNGYANGWRITPHDAGTLTINLRWAPEGLVWWGIGISVLAIVVCLVLALRRRGSSESTEPPTEPSIGTDELPEIASPFESEGAGPSIAITVVTAVSAAVVAGVASRPWIGVVVGLAAAAALRWPRARAVLTVASVLAFAIAAAYVVVQQSRHGYPTISSWPSRFEEVGDLAWLAVLLLGADVVVQRIRDVASRHG